MPSPLNNECLAIAAALALFRRQGLFVPIEPELLVQNALEGKTPPLLFLLQILFHLPAFLGFLQRPDAEPDFPFLVIHMDHFRLHGFSTRSVLNCETWMSPSTPSSRRTKTPKSGTLVASPLILEPPGYRSAITF